MQTESITNNNETITTQFTYDKSNNLINTSVVGGISTSKTYDGQGRILTAIDGKGNTTSYVYDKLTGKTKRSDECTW